MSAAVELNIKNSSTRRIYYKSKLIDRQNTVFIKKVILYLVLVYLFEGILKIFYHSLIHSFAHWLTCNEISPPQK